MTRARTTAPLAEVRASVTRMQHQGERMVARLRRDAEGFIVRSRGEVVKEVRDLERRLVKALHAATAEQVARLDRRVTKLEQAVVDLQKSAGERAA
jgi:hypothetical protein